MIGTRVRTLLGEQDTDENGQTRTAPPDARPSPYGEGVAMSTEHTPRPWINDGDPYLQVCLLSGRIEDLVEMPS